MHICHYLSQWWPRPTSPNGCIRLQWAPGHNGLKSTETLGKSGTLTKDHCSDVKMSTTASQVIGVSIVCPVVCFRRPSMKLSKLRVTSLCEGNPLVAGGFPSQRDQERGKCFNLMTSSCHKWIHFNIGRWIPTVSSFHISPRGTSLLIFFFSLVKKDVAFFKTTLVLTKTRLNKNKIILFISTAWTIINKYFPWKNRVCSGFNALKL